tara:strand:- start:352 stop:1278 length:927 start_codon:yes stop_codon:yes gene_type:complete
MTMNLTHMLNFIQIVEWGSVSKAAAYLNIAQPALSRQVQALENTLDARLLVRQKWGVEPTENGKLLLEHARRIQKECVLARESVRSNNENPAGSVYVGVPSAYSVALIPPLIQRMNQLYPNIQVHVVEGFSRAIYEWLLNGRLDLAVLSHSREHTVDGSIPFVAEEMVALTSPEQFEEISRMSPGELADDKVIAPWQPHFLRQALDTKFIELGSFFKPKLEIDSMRCMIEMAQRGDGTIILPSSCVSRELSEGRLRSMPINPTFRLSTQIGTAPGRQVSRGTSLLRDALNELAVELAPKMDWSPLQTR